MIEGETGAVHQTKTRSRAGYLGDQRTFAKTHFANALAKTFITRQPANTSRGADRKLAEGKVKIWIGVVHQISKLSEMRLSFKGKMAIGKRKARTDAALVGGFA